MNNPSALTKKLCDYCRFLGDGALSRGVAEVERRLNVGEELASVVSANLQRATRLRQPILQKAFTGELV